MLGIQGETYSDQFVFRSCGEVPSIGAEADTANVEIAVLVNALVLEEGHLLAGLHVKDLGRAVASCSHIFSVSAEPHTAHDTIMHQVVDKVNVKASFNGRIEDREPITPFPLQFRRELVRLEISQTVPYAAQGTMQ